jgi:hypothetical protein
MGRPELFFEVFGGDFVQVAGGDPGQSYAQLSGLGQNLLVPQAELLRNVVNTNRHNSLSRYSPNGDLFVTVFRPRLLPSL